MNAPVRPLYRKAVIYMDRHLRWARAARKFCHWMSVGKRCVYCGIDITFKEATLDHVVPLINGGTNRYDNVYPACKKCNHMKGQLSVYDFRGETIGQERGFYYQTGEPINVRDAQLYISLYRKLARKARKAQEPNSQTRENLIRLGLIKEAD